MATPSDMQKIEQCLFSIPCLQTCKLEETAVSSIQEHVESQKKRVRRGGKVSKKQQNESAASSGGFWLLDVFKKFIQ